MDLYLNDNRIKNHSHMTIYKKDIQRNYQNKQEYKHVQKTSLHKKALHTYYFNI